MHPSLHVAPSALVQQPKLQKLPLVLLLKVAAPTINAMLKYVLCE